MLPFNKNIFVHVECIKYYVAFLDELKKRSYILKTVSEELRRVNAKRWHNVDFEPTF